MILPPTRAGKVLIIRKFTTFASAIFVQAVCENLPLRQTANRCASYKKYTL